MRLTAENVIDGLVRALMMDDGTGRSEYAQQVRDAALKNYDQWAKIHAPRRGF